MKQTPSGLTCYVLSVGCILICGVLCDPGTLFAQTPPEGFQVREIVTGLEFPTSFAFAPDGRIFIAEKDGVVRVVKNSTLLDEPLIELSDVNTYYERGLLGIAVDPDFALNGYLYLLYTYENSPGQNFDGPKTGRLVRVTVVEDTASETSKVVLLGSVGGDALNPSCSDFDVTADCIRSDSPSHSVGGLRFGPDEKLYVSLGDGSDFDRADPNALYSLDIDALSGKVLRINTDGTGPADNPFYNGDPDANRSKVWSYGLRNPYRFNFRPSNGELFIADVGWGVAEEVNIDSRGANYGWPCREGLGGTSYNCTTEGYTGPIYHYPHNEAGVATITGGSFPTHNAYPTEYMNSYFFGDYSIGFIREMKLDGQNEIISVKPFIEDAGGPVDILTGPEGALYYIDIYEGRLLKVVYSDENQEPRASIDADPTAGPAPLTVQFSSDDSFDPDGDTLSFVWDFDDGSESSTDANPTHTFSDNGIYTVSLTVEDPEGLTDTAYSIIRVGDEAQNGADPSHTGTTVSPDDNYIGREVEITTTIVNGGFSDPFIVDIEIYDPQGQKVAQRVFEEVTQESGIEKDYTLVWFPPPKVSDYRVAVGLFKTGWSGLYEWVNEAATFRVENRAPEADEFDPRYRSTSVEPGALEEGETTTITTEVENIGGPGSMLVDIEVRKDGKKIAQRFYDNESFAENETREFTLDWEAASSGVYTVSIGLFTPGWSELYSWNSEVAMITVGSEDPEPGLEMGIYRDGLSEGWSNWSWSTDLDLSSTETVFEGLYSARARLNSAWSGVYFHTDPFHTAEAEEITFVISGGSEGGQSLKVFLYDESGNTLPSKALEEYTGSATLGANEWVTVTIPLADLGAENRIITGIALQGRNGAVQPTFFLDNVEVR